ncbi:MAG: TetR/AcrR family transcriptional regulator [Ruminococcaceae bacterium]|nr:TetR/AcrR family transcriptional regulator [Oscillospiraceae bacterium]
MDRRQKKTRDAIFGAFGELLMTNKYENITVQDIIDRADVGRSTFYSHFETKDHLLRAMCADIFEHIFEKATCSYEGSHDDLEGVLSHILFHLKENKKRISGLLCSDSADLFMRYLSEYFNKIFSMYISQFHANVPRDYLINHLTGAFGQTLKWWIHEGMATSHTDMARYFMSVIETH